MVMMAEPGPRPIRKRLLAAGSGPAAPPTGALDLARVATLAYSSEDPAQPVEHLLDRRGGPGGSRWVSARPDTIEQVVVEFDRPQALSRVVYEAEETERERTQEVQIEASADGGRTYQPVITQEYIFSPQGATFEREDLRVELRGITHLRLTIIPHKRGTGAATLTSLELFA
jgi:hypothetical protein